MVVVTITQVWLVQPWSCDPGPSFPPTNPLRLLMAAASMAYAFGGHGVFPEEHREMRDPERWPEVMNWMYAIILPMYTFSAVAGESSRHRTWTHNARMATPIHTRSGRMGAVKVWFSCGSARKRTGSA
jgi:hypothetical protein